MQGLHVLRCKWFLISDFHRQMDPHQAAESDGTRGPEGDVQPREVEYSDIDFSLVKRKRAGGAEDTRETPDTEYAEINNKGTEERQSDGAEDSEVMEGREEEEEEEAIGEDKETEECVLKEEGGGEDVAVYSNVHEIMGESQGPWSSMEGLLFLINRVSFSDGVDIVQKCMF